jgi:hypothetical protein
VGLSSSVLLKTFYTFLAIRRILDGGENKGVKYDSVPEKENTAIRGARRHP